MNLPDLGAITQYMRIPKVFRSSETGKPIDHCLMCNAYLLKDGTPYMVEKAIKQHPEYKITEVIFEYALCAGCMVIMNESLSKESKQRVDAYFQTHGNLVERRTELLKRKTLRVQPWISKCLIKGTSISNSPEYQISGQFDGKHLLFTYMPFALSVEALQEINDLLSAKSKGEIDDFIGKYFSGPPEVSEILKRSLVLI